MKKSSKIWKIENIGYPIYDGCNLLYTKDNSIQSVQKLYDTELDCLLDIVTEPENVGLKVYKHQTVVDKQKNISSAREYVIVRKSKHEYDFYYYCYFKDTFETMEDKNTYEMANELGDSSSNIAYTFTSYHWVEAFLQ
jgi:hypothetical protein